MSNDRSETSTSKPLRGARGPSSLAVSLVFIEWCFRREAPRWPPLFYRLAVLLPVLLTGAFVALLWPRFHTVGSGYYALRELLIAAAIVIHIGGAQFASRAVCWELSAEMREIVRLTSINSRVLLWTTTLTRWWTVGWSLVLLLPLAALVVTFGGVTLSQCIAGAYAMTLMWALTCGFGMLAAVLTSNTKNPEKSVTGATVAAVILYNVCFVLVARTIRVGNWLLMGDHSQAVDRLCDGITSSAPAVGLWLALVAPPLFNPTFFVYWMHFLPAVACALLATYLVEYRFQSSIDPNQDVSIWFRLGRWLSSKRTRSHKAGNEVAVRSDKVRPASPFRPRCTDQPFFWKDLYILGTEGSRISTWTVFYIIATIGVVVTNFMMLNDRDRAWPVVAAILSIVFAPCVISIRFDALLLAEFRDRTWGSLMLLPVDPCLLLREKFRAALWEQRFVLLPIGTAALELLFVGTFYGTVIAGMATVVASLIGLFLCQMSCINHLLGKAWWLGPCQAIGFVATVALLITVWVAAGMWPGFFCAVTLLVVILCALQYACVEQLARNWVES